MLDLKRLWVCDASNTLKLEHARIDKGSKEAWLSFIQREIGMSTYLVILGDLPAGLCLMSKAGHWEYLPWWFVDEDSMLLPWQLLSFFLWSKKREHTQFQDKIWIEKRTYFGVLTYLPHTWSLQNFKCMEFKSPSVVVSSSRHIEVL